MRDTLRGYYPPTKDEFKSLWSSGKVILDTNALLNLYRYTESSRIEFVNVITQMSDRLWLPHQVALEFHRNRVGVIDSQAGAFDWVASKLKATRDASIRDLNAYSRHPSLPSKQIVLKYEAFTEEVLQMVEAARAEHPLMKASPDADAIAVLVTKLFAGRVGPPYTSDQLLQVWAEGKRRYEKGVPPGFADAKKDESARYGDFVLWKQLLDFAEESKCDVIFVTDDSKDDWWRRERGKLLGPRPELIEEFASKTGGRIHLYSPDQFLSYAKQNLKATVSDDTFREVQSVSSGLEGMSSGKWTPSDESSSESNRIVVLQDVLDRLHGMADARNRLSKRRSDVDRWMLDQEMKIEKLRRAASSTRASEYDLAEIAEQIALEQARLDDLVEEYAIWDTELGEYASEEEVREITSELRYLREKHQASQSRASQARNADSEWSSSADST